MKTRTISALEQALADIGGGTNKAPDEITAVEIVGPGISITTAQRRLKALCEAGKYERRKLGNEWLYKKVDTPAKRR